MSGSPCNQVDSSSGGLGDVITGTPSSLCSTKTNSITISRETHCQDATPAEPCITSNTPQLPGAMKSDISTENADQGSNVTSSTPNSCDKVKRDERAVMKAAPIPGRCQFYLPRKRRHCRTVPAAEKEFCVEHSIVNQDDNARKRITCPLDPKHTCYEDQLTNHLKKCNARREALPIYWVENINAGCIEDGEGLKVAVSTVEPDEIKSMVEVVNRLYKEKVKDIEKSIQLHSVLEEEMEKPSNGPAALKHLKQQASLVGHVDHQGLLHDKCCYIEFGAGKAGLSHWVQRALPSCNNSKFVLVDKSSVRYKMDVYHRGEHQGPDFERLRIDIQHLDLNKVPSLIDNQLPIIGLGKHLCGGATDLMLRCLMQTVKETSTSSHKNPYVEGLVLALCCHHRCDWQTFVGKEAMRNWGVGPREFSLMTSMTSWATCATRTFLKKLKERELEADSKSSQDDDHVVAGDEDEDKPYSHPRYGSMTPEDREDVGFKCKKLIDMARVHYLQQNRFSAKLVQYAELEHTLENIVLVANNTLQPEASSLDGAS